MKHRIPLLRRLVFTAFILTFALTCNRAGLLPKSPKVSNAASNSLTAASSSAIAHYDSAKVGQLLESYGQLPLRFEANRGQFNRQVRFLGRERGYSLLLNATEAVFQFRDHTSKVKDQPGFAKSMPNTPEFFLNRTAPKPSRLASVRMKLVGANPSPSSEGLEPLPGKINYFIGSNPERWHMDISTFAKVAYRNIYPGVDLVWYVDKGQLKYDFIVAPGAEPSVIKLAFTGARKLEITADGDLVISAAGRKLVQRKPVIWQYQNGQRKEVPGHFVKSGRWRVGFEVLDYDSGRPLIIDPVLIYSTYLGGSGSENATGVAVDTLGNAYITGYTDSVDFPVTAGSFMTTRPAANGAAFVTKIDPTGRAIIYSTFIGDQTGTRANAIAVDKNGNAHITGTTGSGNDGQSSSFPTTPGAFQKMTAGSTAFVTRLNASGNDLIYSSYIGNYGALRNGDYGSLGYGIAVDAVGGIYLTGTAAANFPTTGNAFQCNYAGGDVASGRAGDVFVAKFDPSKSGADSLAYSSYLGGAHPLGSGDVGSAIAVDSLGMAYVTGYTASPNFPVTLGAFQTSLGAGNCAPTTPNFCPDAFVAKFNFSAATPKDSLVYSTYLGNGPTVTNCGNNSGAGCASDSATGIAVDSNGQVYVTGPSTSANFPVTPGALNLAPADNGFGIFVTKLNQTGAGLVYSARINVNQTSTGIAIDSTENAYITGYHDGPLSITPDAFQKDLRGINAYLIKLNSTGSALLYATQLGGGRPVGASRATGIAVDPIGDAYVVGYTNSANFPTRFPVQADYGGGSSDAFLAKFGFGVQSQLSISGILPNKGGNTGQITTTVYGGGLVVGTKVTLKCSGQADISGEQVVIGFQGRTIITTFNLKDKTPGTCDVVVTRPDGASVMLPRGLTIEQGGAPQVWVDVVGRNQIRGGREQVYFIQCGNHGNVNAQLITVWVALPSFLTQRLFIEQQAVLIRDLGDKTVLAIPIKQIDAGGTIMFPIALTAPTSPEFAHLKFNTEVWAIPTPSAIFSTSNSIGLSARKALFSNVSPLIQPNQFLKTVLQSSLNCGLPCGSPCGIENEVRLELDVDGICINECSCTTVPTGERCTDVGCIRRSTIEGLEELVRNCKQSDPNCEILITGGCEKIEHKDNPDPNARTHANGYKVDLRKSPELDKYIRTTCQSIGTRSDGSPQYKCSCGSIYADEPRDKPHWDVVFPGDGSCGGNGGGIGGMFGHSGIGCPYPVTEIVTPNDPNDKIGARGIGTVRWLSGNEPLRYSIFLENKPTATADAQDVVVTDQLDPSKVDLTTFKLGSVTFIDKVITPQANFNPLVGSNEFNAEVDLRPARNLALNINAALNPQTGMLTWRFHTFDPATRQSPPLDGFLKPGQEGSVSFTVMPKQGLPTGTQIKNKASIKFDFNAPLDTPEWFNTLDQTKPVSSVLALNATQTSASFPVKWTGTDVGAGVQDYTIFVSENGGPFTAWLTNTSATEAIFPGQNGSRYAFYSVARDLVGNVENAKTSAEATTLVNQTPPQVTVTIADPADCTGVGNVVGMTAQIINPSGIQQNTSFTATLPAQLLALSGSCTVTAGTCTIANASTVNWSGMLAAGQTVTIKYQAQVANAPVGAQLCVTSSANFDNGTPAAVQTCTTVNCPSVGPGDLFPASSTLSDQKAGSVLFFNIYTSSASNPNAQNARISLTNADPGRPVGVHLFFVDGGSCSVADAFLCLTPNQTTSFQASDLDPGATGYLIAVAVDAAGCPINFNSLLGDEYVKFSSGHAANLRAVAASALSGGLPACDANSVTATLNFDGLSYNLMPRALALSNIPDCASGNDTMLIVNRVGGNLAIGAATLDTLFGILYDDAENGVSFSISGGCQLRGSLSNSFPRTTPRLESFIPAGHSGWMKLYSFSDIGMLGAAINFNPNAGSNAGAFNQGHNLHVLTLTGAATLTIPVFPSPC